MEFQFKKNNPATIRKNQMNSLLRKYPNKIPIILEKEPHCRLNPIEKTKFLCHKEFSVNQFAKMVRALMKMPENEALFFSAT